MIVEFNPWWIGETDKDLEEFEKLEYKLIPTWIRKVSVEPFSLNFVVGVRRVGKTLGIKLLIRDLLKNVNPYAIFYFSCEVLEDYRDLIDVLNDYFELREKKGVKTSYIFLDEITLLEDWWRAIKFMVDRHKFERDVVVLLGSALIMLTQHFETFGGRMGKGRVVEVLPLSFREYYGLFYDEYFNEIGCRVFERFIDTGGFLCALNGKLEAYELVSLIKADIKKIERTTEIARDVLREIMLKAPSACSYHAIANDIGVSTNTVREYVEILRELFLLLEVKYMGLDGRVYPRKEKKFVIRDPFLVKATSIWTKSEVKKDFLYEWIVQEHLFRKFGEVYYYRDRYEIDCLAGNLKVEVKAGKPHRRYPKGVTILGEDDIPKFLFELIA